MITIVMPVYNTGIYLEEALKCILMQTYTNYELICVDDCSKDELTCSILDMYEKKDERIKVVHLLENHGSAEARNIGLNQAKGEYIIFLDADDMFDVDMLERMHSSITKTNAEMVVCGYRIWSEESQSIIEERMLKTISGITDRVFEVKELGEEGLMYWSTAPWNKLCRKKFLEKNKIYFQTLSSSNDVYYSMICSLTAKKIAYCDNGRALISYRIDNCNQISTNSTPINFWYAIQQVLKERSVCMTNEEWLQIMYALLLGEVGELRRTLNDNKRKESYNKVREFIITNKERLCFKNRQINYYVTFYLQNSYETKWFEKAGDFESQLQDNTQELLSIFECKEKRIVIWGNGQRGQALQRYCLKRNIANIRIADKKNDGVGLYTSNGFLIIHTNEVKESADLIIASNSRIYDELATQLEGVETKLVDLVQFCPID